MALYDLTATIGKHLDRHLVFPLLEFLSGKETYHETELLQGKFDLLANTNMVDFAMDIHKNLYPDDDIPEYLTDKRPLVLETYKKLQDEVKPIVAIMEEEVVLQQIQNSRDSRHLVEFLEEKFDFKPEMTEKLYKNAKFQYECGNYSGAAQYLYLYRLLVPSHDKNYVSALWGKLASEILMQNWDQALEDQQRLKDYLDTTVTASALEQLQSRTWLIHWSLFVFFNHSKGRDMIIDMFLHSPQYLNAIQTICPHILRYLATAVITNRNQRRNVMKDLIKVIQQESYHYSDPITAFLEDLYVNFDFDSAQEKLRLCEDVLVKDFFLVACLDDFIENARLMIFETFCRIHQCISIGMLADKLNMTVEEAERWIVNLIRNARLDAKIDSAAGHVVMGTQGISPYLQLIEKTKALAMRSQMLAFNVEKRASSKSESQWGGHDF